MTYFEPKDLLNIDNINEFVKQAYEQGRADAIDDCKAVLKAHHMSRTCDDDFVPRVEIPFYRGLWKRFEELKEQK